MYFIDFHNDCSIPDIVKVFLVSLMQINYPYIRAKKRGGNINFPHASFGLFEISPGKFSNKALVDLEEAYTAERVCLAISWYLSLVLV